MPPANPPSTRIAGDTLRRLARGAGHPVPKHAHTNTMLSAGTPHARWQLVLAQPPPRSLHLDNCCRLELFSAAAAAAAAPNTDTFRVVQVFPASLERRLHALAPHLSELQPLFVLLRCVPGSKEEVLQERGWVVFGAKRASIATKGYACVWGVGGTARG